MLNFCADIACGIQFHLYKKGQQHPTIGKIKDFLRMRPYIKKKPTRGIIFDDSLQEALAEFQRYKRLKVTDGLINEETYAAIGKEMSRQQIDTLVMYDEILRWLLLGQPQNRIPFDVTNKKGIEKSNGNLDDERVDRELALLLTKGGLVRGASADRNHNPKIDSHFRLTDGKIYTIHIYGDETGTAFTGIYLPKFLKNPKYENDKQSTVSATTSSGEVLGIAHVNVYSQAELTANYKSGKENAAGSIYIGDIGGLGGDSPCYRHAHLHFYPNADARRRIKELKSGNYGGDDPSLANSKMLLDVRELLRK